MPAIREKFATQVNSEILSAVRSLAEKEGRQLQVLVEEALADLIEKRKKGYAPRARHGRLPRQPRQVRFPVQKAR